MRPAIRSLCLAILLIPVGGCTALAFWQQGSEEIAGNGDLARGENPARTPLRVSLRPAYGSADPTNAAGNSEYWSSYVDWNDDPTVANGAPCDLSAYRYCRFAADYWIARVELEGPYRPKTCADFHWSVKTPAGREAWRWECFDELRDPALPANVIEFRSRARRDRVALSDFLTLAGNAPLAWAPLTGALTYDPNGAAVSAGSVTDWRPYKNTLRELTTAAPGDLVTEYGIYVDRGAVDYGATAVHVRGAHTSMVIAPGHVAQVPAAAILFDDQSRGSYFEGELRAAPLAAGAGVVDHPVISVVTPYFRIEKSRIDNGSRNYFPLVFDGGATTGDMQIAIRGLEIVHAPLAGHASLAGIALAHDARGFLIDHTSVLPAGIQSPDGNPVSAPSALVRAYGQTIRATSDLTLAPGSGSYGNGSIYALSQFQVFGTSQLFFASETPIFIGTTFVLAAGAPAPRTSSSYTVTVHSAVNPIYDLDGDQVVPEAPVLVANAYERHNSTTALVGSINWTVELPFDGIGNDDLLCQSAEDCVVLEAGVDPLSYDLRRPPVAMSPDEASAAFGTSIFRDDAIRVYRLQP